MTIPYLMNCNHTGDGWCSACVKAMGEENDRLIAERNEAIEALVRMREVADKWRNGVCRLTSEMAAMKGTR